MVSVSCILTTSLIIYDFIAVFDDCPADCSVLFVHSTGGLIAGVVAAILVVIVVVVLLVLAVVRLVRQYKDKKTAVVHDIEHGNSSPPVQPCKYL